MVMPNSRNNRLTCEVGKNNEIVCAHPCVLVHMSGCVCMCLCFLQHRHGSNITMYSKRLGVEVVEEQQLLTDIIVIILYHE